MDQPDQPPACEEAGKCVCPPANDDFDLSQPIGELRRGKLPGRERVRVVYPAHPEFRRISKGVLEATQAVETERSGPGKAWMWLRHTFIGVPLPTWKAEHERL